MKYGPEDYWPHKYEEDDLIAAIDLKRLFDGDPDTLAVAWEYLRPLILGRNGL